MYVLEGRPTLIAGLGLRELAPGMCIGFKAADGNAHHIVNRTDADVVLLEIGDRSAGDEVAYPRRRHPGRLRPRRQTDLHAQGRDAVLIEAG